MQIRILSWLFLGVLAAVLPLRAQTPAAASVADAPMPPGLVLVAKVTGEVMMTVNGSAPVRLNVDDKIAQSAKINTGPTGSVVLVFANGAQTQISHDSELVLEEFLQDPFGSTVKVAEMTAEPSVSRTKLSLNRGELVGNVKKLNHDRGSKFTVQTPVGAAGIRGTTFKITFRPTGTGQAFNFQLSTVEGNVGFTPPGAGGNAGGGNAGGGNNQGGGANTGNQNAGGTPTATATGTVTGVTGGVAVPQGQEITITVTVTTNAQGQQVVTMPPNATLPATVSIPAAVVTQVTQVAQEIAVAVQQAVFTSSAPAPSSGSGAAGGGQTNSNSGTGGGNSGSGGGGTTGSTSGSTTGSTSGSTTGSTGGSTTGSTSGSTTGSTGGNTGGTTGGNSGGSTGGNTGNTGGTGNSGTNTTGGTTTSGTSNATSTTVNISGQKFTGTATITPPPAAIPTSQLNTKP